MCCRCDTATLPLRVENNQAGVADAAGTGPQAGRVYVNICSADKVDTFVQHQREGGSSFDVPYSLGNMRDDTSNDGSACKAVDLVVHPDTLARAQRDERFKGLVAEVARDAVQSGRDVKLLDGLYCPKGMTYKGPKEGPSVQTVRGKGKEHTPKEGAMVRPKGVPSDVAELQKESRVAGETAPAGSSDKSSTFSFDLAKANAPKPKLAPSGQVIPDHTLVHSGTLRYHEHFAPEANLQDSLARSSLPEYLIATVRLGELSSAAAADLDVSSHRLVLTSKPRGDFPGYLLELTLPHEVDDARGAAKWYKDKRELKVTLPVVPPPKPPPKPFVEPEPEAEEAAAEAQSDGADGGADNVEQETVVEEDEEAAEVADQPQQQTEGGADEGPQLPASAAVEEGPALPPEPEPTAAVLPEPQDEPACAPEPAIPALKPSFGGSSVLYEIE